MIVRKLKSKVYPHIRLKQKHNALYTPEQLLDTLAYAALTHDFTTNGAKCFRLINGEAPHPNTILYQAAKGATDYRSWIKYGFREVATP